ncbi:hypothetical protein LCGC14_0607800 [marine sediment metagenome]|uniref:Uncharacterized protein n=1 Tax=marine sediment metagenome TaxID=412755 RepID=A0A0F9UH50_9ZZZZ
MLSDIELMQMRATQAGAFNDEVNITVNILTQDTLGDEVRNPVVYKAIACGVVFLDAGSEARREAAGRVDVDYDAIIRLPLDLGIAVDMNTEYEIVDKAGTAIRRTFRPIASPEIGVSAQNVKVKEVTN